MDDSQTIPLPGWFRALRRAVDAATSALNVAGTLLIVALMALVNADVIGRGAFDAPISGVPEMVAMSIVAIVFLQVAQAFRKGRLTRAELLPGWLEPRHPKLREALEVVYAVAAAALVWQIIAASWPLLEKAWVRGTYEGTLGDFTAPIWPVKAVIVLGAAALFVQIVLHGAAAFLRLLSGVRA